MKNKNLFLGLSFSTFIFFAISLAVPTGYSYGPIGFLVCSVIGYKFIELKKIDSQSKILALVIFFMGGLWWFSFDDIFQAAGTDQWLKYWLAAFCLLFAARMGIFSGAIVGGLAAGAVGALGIAIYQNMALGIGKATGFTNAIQYGGISMYLGIATWCFAFFAGYQLRYALLLWMAGGAGVLASLLSETRGAWIVIPMLLGTIFLIFIKNGHRKILAIFLGLFFIFSLALYLPNVERIENRIHAAVVEFNSYKENPEKNVETSIGQRLEQWSLAWSMGLEKPIFGWGVKGFVQGKKDMVEAGLAHPSVNHLGHVHNEILDMFAKRGLIGVAMLLIFYAVPLFVFWPTCKNMQRLAPSQQKIGLALRTAATLLPVAYFGFGWTQVFFAHNSGNMFYVFSLVALWGAIRNLEGNTISPIRNSV